MTEPNHTAHASDLPDDQEMVDVALKTPSQGGRSGDILQRDIATQAEEEHLIDGKKGVTRVRKQDERK